MVDIELDFELQRYYYTSGNVNLLIFEGLIWDKFTRVLYSIIFAAVD